MTKQPNRLGPDWDPSNVGPQADAHAVAWTALHLDDHHQAHPMLPGQVSRHAVALHVISGRLHRLDERACGENLTCQKCGGDGDGPAESDPKTTGPRQLCPACWGSGLTIGRTVAHLEAAAQEIAALYGLRAYHQGDCRGCALYLCAPANANAAKYDQGHAVTRLGR